MLGQNLIKRQAGNQVIKQFVGKINAENEDFPWPQLRERASQEHLNSILL